jgi:hypothetical protein
MRDLCSAHQCRRRYHQRAPRMPQSPCLRPAPQDTPEARPSPRPRRVSRPRVTMLRAAQAGLLRGPPGHHRPHGTGL